MNRTIPPCDMAELLRMKPIARVAELMAREFDNQEIADILGYASTASVNGTVQRIRQQLGSQAV